MNANAEEQQIVGAIIGLFNAIGAEDASRFHSITSPEFYMFDGGAYLDGKEMLDCIKALHATGKRFEWEITNPDVHIEGNTAWIAYINKGRVTDASSTSQQNWLESGVLHKRQDEWKIVFMHSSRMPMKAEANGRSNTEK
jgi:ketosteroid isomerase-like protein